MRTPTGSATASGRPKGERLGLVLEIINANVKLLLVLEGGKDAL